MPTFGNTDENITWSTLEQYTMGGFHNTNNENSITPESITFYVRVQGNTYNSRLQTAIYEYIDYSSSYAGDMIISSNAVTQNITNGWSGWITINFSGSTILSPNTNYYLLAYGEWHIFAGIDMGLSQIGGSATDIFKSALSIGDAFPDPFTGESASTHQRMIYCTYSEVAGGGTTNQFGFQGEGNMVLGHGSGRLTIKGN